MEETLESCTVRSPITSPGKWTCKSSYVGEIYAVLGTDSNKVQNSLLVNKIHLQRRKIQGIYSVYSSNLVLQICFITAFVKWKLV